MMFKLLFILNPYFSLFFVLFSTEILTYCTFKGAVPALLAKQGLLDKSGTTDEIMSGAGTLEGAFQRFKIILKTSSGLSVLVLEG